MFWLLPPLPPHFHAALRDVHAQSHEARIRAGQRLALAEGQECEPAQRALETLSTDAHPHVRATAVAGLGELAHATSLDAVIDRIDDPSAEVRELAMLAVGRIGGERARSVLLDALRNDAAEVRFQALASVAEGWPEEAASPILALLDDPDPQVRGQVADVLGRLGEPHTRGHLACLLDDSHPHVALEAAIALAHQHDARGEATLIAALRVRRRVHEVCLSLAAVAGEQGREALAALAGRFLAPAAHRAAASAALSARGDPRGSQGLRRVLCGFNTPARSYAVELVGNLGLTALAPDLAQLSRRPRGTDPYLLVEALTQLATRGAEVGGALTHLAARSDAAGEAARGWLQHESSTTQS